MLSELPSLGPAFSWCPLRPWTLGGALFFAGISVTIPLSPLSSPHAVLGTTLGKSSEQLDKVQECPVPVLSVTCLLPLGVGSSA